MNIRISFIYVLLFISIFMRGQDNSEATANYKALYSAQIELSTGTDAWARGIASIVFDETLSEVNKTTIFQITRENNTLLVNGEVALMNDKENTIKALKNCKTLKKTCRSEECVTDTLIEILGDGKRNVLIKYERKLLSVLIYYTYQDCQ